MVADRMIAFLVAALRRLHGRARRRRPRPVRRALPRPGAVRASPSSRRSSRVGLIVDLPGRSRCCPTTSSAGSAALGPRQGRARAHWRRRLATVPASLSARRARTAIDLVRDPRRRRCSARSPGGRSTSRCCGRRSTRSATAPPIGGASSSATSSGMLGNLLPLPGRHRRRRRRHDRRLHRRSASTSASRSSRC